MRIGLELGPDVELERMEGGGGEEFGAGPKSISGLDLAGERHRPEHARPG